MNEQAIVPANGALKLERVLLTGDLEPLTAAERLEYYETLCSSLGLNPLSRPFDYLKLNGKLVLYAKRDATDQLRKLHGVSITRLERERTDDVYVVTAYATTRDGRTDSSIGAVAVGSLKGEFLANAYMKCETKAKRRVTLSICGLGLLDELEVETIPGATTVPAETVTVNQNALPATRASDPATAPPENAPDHGALIAFAGDTETERADDFEKRALNELGIDRPGMVALLGEQVSTRKRRTNESLEQVYLVLKSKWDERQGAPRDPAATLAESPGRGG